MLLPRRIKLLLATALVSSLTFVVAAYSSSDAKTGSQISGNTLRSKILRPQNQLKEKPNAHEKALLRKHAAAEGERYVENKIPNHVPIKTRLKPDKEKKFRDIENPDWFRDFELEVTNTSGKPIYYLNIWLVYPEVISESGKRIGVVLRYGRMDFVDFDTRPIPADVPILPGETITLKIPEMDQKGWLAHKIRENRPDPKRVELSLTQVSFGDGSGFNGSDGRPYPYTRESSNRVCSEEPEPPEKVKKTPGRFNALFQAYSMQQPAEILPVNFFATKSSPIKPRAQSGLCCPGTNCSWKKKTTYYCSCRRAETTTPTACSDPQGQCSIDEFIDSWCVEFGVACPEWRLGPCGNISGGGGGGDPTYRGEHQLQGFAYSDQCTNYVWVWYVSYDDGDTWEPTGEEDYAGCW
jgi:hypothetical protein